MRDFKASKVLKVVVALWLVTGGCGDSLQVPPVLSTSTTAMMVTAATPVAVPTTAVPTTAVPTTTEVPTTTAPPTSTTTTLPSLPSAAECIAKLPVGLRVGQVILPLATQAELPLVADLVVRGLVAGVVVVGAVGDGFASAISAVQAGSATGPVIVAVDEEGGRVQRFESVLGSMPAAAEMAALSVDEVRSLAMARAESLAARGVTMNLAPVLDVGASPGIGDRSFSSDPEVVSSHGIAFAEGLLAGGLIPVVKHFPGHGRANADSHRELATTPPLDDLWDVDLLPFVLAPQGAAVMVGHLVVPGLTDGGPATLAPAAITGLLRNDLGFQGVVITDDLSMASVAQLVDVPSAALLALIAGADLLMVGSHKNVVPAAWSLVGALDDGSLDERWLDEAVERVLAMRGVDPCVLVGSGT
ncbi:MAG: glycoside hydrolase family 3 N-terminal domain-containing protein [Acidimicrobiales bacterium]|nr:glycoside hydrolase family 3 N-terminal domain-containing protein [Acidimicrobiales bacterium]